MLTQSQLQTLKADILGDPVLNSQPNNSDGNSMIAAAYNVSAVPDCWVWRTSVSKAEYTGSASVDATVFSWSGTGGFISRSVGEQTAWQEMFGDQGLVNPSLANVRQGFVDIFSGNGAGAINNRTHMATVSRRKATRAEKLFATGTGSTSSPALMTFEGFLNYQDIQEARDS